MSQNQPTTPPEDSIREHSFDGIQEYNKRLPNWWLFTLYGAIVFFLAYWSYYQWFHIGLNGPQTVEKEMARIEAQRLAANPKLDDASFWQMSRNPVFVEAGRATFNATCVACHLQSLRGKHENAAAIGPDLTDTAWLHGGRPTEVYQTITNGVPAKGMPTWGPVLGPKKISELVAYVYSHHKEGEPILVDDGAPVAK